METYVGCSGYYYNHWIGRFYPEDLPKNKRLIHYSEHFNTVEINNTFYRMPEEKPILNWYAITPKNFLFAVKGSRYFTHRKRLIVDDQMLELLDRFQKTISNFRDKLGPVLWQLPGSSKGDPERLEKFCSVLSKDFRYVFEFRNASWFTLEIYDILRRYNSALCVVSSPGNIPEVVEKTADFVYMRFHGKGSWYADNYSNAELESWKLSLDKTKAKRLFVYFNNDANAYAVNNGKYFAALYEK